MDVGMPYRGIINQVYGKENIVLKTINNNVLLNNFKIKINASNSYIISTLKFNLTKSLYTFFGYTSPTRITLNTLLEKIVLTIFIILSIPNTALLNDTLLHTDNNYCSVVINILNIRSYTHLENPSGLFTVPSRVTYTPYMINYSL